jgi:hypothetical protein
MTAPWTPEYLAASKRPVNDLLSALYKRVTTGKGGRTAGTALRQSRSAAEEIARIVIDEWLTAFYGAGTPLAVGDELEVITFDGWRRGVVEELTGDNAGTAFVELGVGQTVSVPTWCIALPTRKLDGRRINPVAAKPGDDGDWLEYGKRVRAAAASAVGCAETRGVLNEKILDAWFTAAGVPSREPDRDMWGYLTTNASDLVRMGLTGDIPKRGWRDPEHLGIPVLVVGPRGEAVNAIYFGKEGYGGGDIRYMANGGTTTAWGMPLFQVSGVRYPETPAGAAESLAEIAGARQ